MSAIFKVCRFSLVPMDPFLDYFRLYQLLLVLPVKHFVVGIVTLLVSNQ